MKVYETASSILIECAEYIGLIIKFCGLALICFAFIKTIIKMFKTHKLDALKINLDSEFNHYLSAALEILLASEIIETIALKTISSLIEVIILVGVRVLIAFVLTLEDKEKTKKAHEELEQPQTKKKTKKESK